MPRLRTALTAARSWSRSEFSIALAVICRCFGCSLASHVDSASVSSFMVDRVSPAAARRASSGATRFAMLLGCPGAPVRVMTGSAAFWPWLAAAASAGPGAGACNASRSGRIRFTAAVTASHDATSGKYLLSGHCFQRARPAPQSTSKSFQLVRFSSSSALPSNTRKWVGQRRMSTTTSPVSLSVRPCLSESHRASSASGTHSGGIRGSGLAPVTQAAPTW